MSKRMRLTADEVLEMVLQESDDEDMGEIDDPHEPILDGSEDDFELVGMLIGFRRCRSTAMLVS